MKTLPLFIFLLLVLPSCSGKEKMPADIFSVNQMKRLVWDMEMADQTAAERFSLQKDSQRMLSTALYQTVLAKYKTNRKTFYKSFSYYEAHPVLLKLLFDSVSNYGSRQKSALYKKAY